MNTPRQELDSLIAQIADQDYVSPGQKRELKKLDQIAQTAQEKATGESYSKITAFRQQIAEILMEDDMKVAELEIEECFA